MIPIEKKLENGLRIITVPMKDNPTVTVMVMVEAGTRYETHENNGISHFLEHMCFKGTTTRSFREIFHEIESLGAYTNAFTWYDYTGYYAKGKSETFSKLLDIVSDVYLNSTFPEIELEKEKGVICGEIDMYEDLPQQKVQYLFAQSLYGDQPAGYTILGPKENIRKFTRQHFLDYHNEHYIADKTIIVVTGGIETDQIVTEIENAFKNVKRGIRIEKEKISDLIGDQISIQNKKTDQSHIVVGLRTVPMQHPDASALAVLVGVLGSGASSRLFIKLREEMGSGYYIRANYPQGNDYGELEISTGTEPMRVPEVIKAIGGEIATIKKELVSENELNRAKEYIIGNLYMDNESSDNIAQYFADKAILHQPLKTLDKIEQEIRVVTAEDVQRVANEYLKPEKFHLAIIGPHENSEEIKAAFRFS